MDDYAGFVRHPRYGERPRITGLEPQADALGRVVFHWHSPEGSRVPNTAIAADLAKQPPATVAVTHYCDAKRSCRDCGRSFLFFAAEQQYWYEELGFPLEADCVRCSDCRRHQRGIAQMRERYEELFHVATRSAEQSLEMADCCLSLVEAKLFPERKLEHVRALLKCVAPSDSTTQPRRDALSGRLAALETQNRKERPE